jgi:NADH:ubiquinone oxidoreductase subunit 6 (subunit J)
MINRRSLGIVIALVGAVATAIAALANPLGLGEDEVFGWLQITGVIVGAIVTLLGLALAMEWIPYARRTTTAATSSQNTTVVTETQDPATSSQNTPIVTEKQDPAP